MRGVRKDKYNLNFNFCTIVQVIQYIMRRNPSNFISLLDMLHHDDCLFQCRFVFGNNLAPNTLILHLDDSHIIYTTTTPTTPFDLYMHDLKLKSDSLRLMFVPSEKYTGNIVDEYVRFLFLMKCTIYVFRLCIHIIKIKIYCYPLGIGLCTSSYTWYFYIFTLELFYIKIHS